MDMNQCQKGDKLRLRNDGVATYVGKSDHTSVFTHIIFYGAEISVTDKGEFLSVGSSGFHNFDVISIITDTDMDKIKEDVIPKDNVVNYDSLDTKLKTRIKDICDSYEQDIPCNIERTIFPDNVIYSFTLQAFGVYKIYNFGGYNINNFDKEGLIAYFKNEVEAETCISILHKAVSTNSCDIYKENDNHDAKFTLNKDEIEILVYVGVKNEAKIIH
jgi:hypothetical protein